MVDRRLQADVDRWIKKVQMATTPMGHKKVLRKGAPPLIKEMKQQIKTNANTMGRPKTAYVDRFWKGSFRGRYYQGNLMRSIKHFTWKRSPDVFVGAKLQSGGGQYSSASRRADGWYAHMVNNGDSKHRGIHFLEKARAAKEGESKKLIIHAAKVMLVYGKRKHNLAG